MISGVNYGYFIDMFLKGIGYRLWFYKNILFFNIGYTHLVQYKVVENVLIRTLKNQLIIFAINNILLNTIAYDLVKIKSPDIYRGKGVRFVDRDFKLKLGKQR
jgi:large subunit ribosomal protein L6